MSIDQCDPVTKEEIEEWAEDRGFDEDDLRNFAAIIQAGQLMINILSEDGLSDHSRRVTDDVYQAVYEASSIDPDEDYPYPEPMRQYIPALYTSFGIQHMRHDDSE